MWYACVPNPFDARPRGCGHRERAWNSRDGVTPFAAACPSCGGTMSHVDWGRDEYAPGHRPHEGQAVWRDGVEADVLPAFERRVREAHAAGRTDVTVEGLLASLQPGWPWLERHARGREYPEARAAHDAALDAAARRGGDTGRYG